MTHGGGDEDEERDEGNPRTFYPEYLTLTQNHLETLKITFESWREEGSRYLMENVAEKRNVSEFDGRMLPAAAAETAGAEEGSCCVDDSSDLQLYYGSG